MGSCVHPFNDLRFTDCTPGTPIGRQSNGLGDCEPHPVAFYPASNLFLIDRLCVTGGRCETS
jgi:hypothetical protein